jgi:hypothetical protein
MKTQVMKQAWQIAREGAARFGGRVVEFFAEALREAWRLAKLVVPVMAGAMMVEVAEVEEFVLKVSGKASRPATYKQYCYLTDLMDENDVCCNVSTFTKRVSTAEASEAIDAKKTWCGC